MSSATWSDRSKKQRSRQRDEGQTYVLSHSELLPGCLLPRAADAPYFELVAAGGKCTAVGTGYNQRPVLCATGMQWLA